MKGELGGETCKGTCLSSSPVTQPFQLICHSPNLSHLIMNLKLVLMLMLMLSWVGIKLKRVVRNLPILVTTSFILLRFLMVIIMVGVIFTEPEVEFDADADVEVMLSWEIRLIYGLLKKVNKLWWQTNPWSYSHLISKDWILMLMWLMILMLLLHQIIYIVHIVVLIQFKSFIFTGHRVFSLTTGPLSSSRATSLLAAMLTPI